MTEYTLHLGDCLEVMATLPANSFDSIVSDPPYGLSFMGRDWDHGVPGVPFWEAALRVAKPGAMMLAFGGTRTHHRLMVAIEDAGWEIRDCLMWLYGCLSEDTEILIDGQWEPYHKAMAGKRALCYNIDNDSFEWQEIQELLVYDYADTAYRIQSNSTDQIVSRNHRCIIERGGRNVFEVAEEVARQRQARVPVLEDLHGLFAALPVPDKRTGDAQSGMFKGMQRSVNQRERTGYPKARERTCGNDACCLRRLRPTILQGAVTCGESIDSNLLARVQRGAARRGMGKARLQGPSRLDGKIRSVFPCQNDGCEQSGVEGGSNLLPQAWQLQADQVCALPSGIHSDGAQGRLHYGASANSGTVLGASTVAGRSSASRQPRPDRQLFGESATVCQQPRPQVVRTSGYTRSDLATVTPFFYKGIVWCVRVPSGAFVARRNGRIFVTGNSGFPKSMDIGKAIDKHLGSEREVVGLVDGRGAYDNSQRTPREKFTENVWNNGESGGTTLAPITAPATVAAKQWDGWHTALKPAWEPIILAMKPLDGTFANNALKHGVGGLNVDACRIEVNGESMHGSTRGKMSGAVGGNFGFKSANDSLEYHPLGRWPANLLLDEEAAALLDEQSGERKSGGRIGTTYNGQGAFSTSPRPSQAGKVCKDFEPSTGGASRFFYVAKASRRDRNEGLEGMPERMYKRRDDLTVEQHEYVTAELQRLGLA